MKRYFYFVAKFFKNGIEGIANGIQESDNGYFDIICAQDTIAKREDVKKVVVTFWAETNSVMFGKFRLLAE